MSALPGIPRDIRWTVALGLLSLAVAVPFSAPDGTGMQWDELVLACIAASSGWSIVRLLRRMDAGAARPWRVVAVGAALFAVASLLVGLSPGPAFDGFGVDDVVLLLGACSPIVTCALLARRVRRTRWAALVLDGAVVVAALLVVTEVLRTPLLSPANAPDDLRTLVLAYGGYAAVMLGAAGALCTVSTSALRRSATIMIGAIAFQATAACAEALAIVSPSMLWTAVSDVSVALGLQAVVLAAGYAPSTSADRSARATAPKVSPVGMALVVGALLGVPFALCVSLWQDRPLSDGAEVGCAVVLALVAVRFALRIREDGRVTEDLVRNEEDFRSLVESSSDGVAIVDDELRLLFTSPAARIMLGLLPDGEHDCALLDLVEPEDRALVRASIEAGGVADAPVLHFRVPRSGEEPGELEATTSVRPGSDRRVLYLRDVTTRRNRERELERMAYTDHLTALPNRAHLFQEMAAPSTASRCLLVLDLDGFKAVNDVAGHEAGDQLLVEVARRLNTVIRGDDLVARLGGDEFAVLVSGVLSEAVEVAQRVVDVMAMPHRVGDWTFALGASVGVATLQAGGGQVAFREADAALRQAKQAGKGCVRVADEEHLTFVPDGVDLDTVIAEGEVTTRLDAACDAEGRFAVVHAVPVWEHPTHGRVRGQDLWGTAERQGRSGELQRWLLRQACRDAASLDEGTAIAISLPAGHVTAEGLATEVAAALADAGLAPSRLILSFTEETLLTSSAALVPELEAARRTGVRLCLDNYGMGHSLFALLARISLDVVRVDVAALAARDDTERAFQVLASIVRSTTDFGLQAIAGGIATPELATASFDCGVDLVHGRSQPHDLALAELLDGAAVLPAS